MPSNIKTAPMIITARFMSEHLSTCLVKLGSLAFGASKHTPTPYGRRGNRSVKARRLRTACGGSSSGFLGSLGGCRGLTAPSGLGRRGGSLADQFGRHHTRNKQLGTMIVEINGGALLIRRGHDSQAVHLMLDGLPFLHCLHNVLLDKLRGIKLVWWVPRLGSQGTRI